MTQNLDTNDTWLFTESEMHRLHGPVTAFAFPFAYYNSGDPHNLCPSIFTSAAECRAELTARGDDWPIMAITEEYIVVRVVDCEAFDDVASLERTLDGCEREEYDHLYSILDKLVAARGRLGTGE